MPELRRFDDFDLIMSFSSSCNDRRDDLDGFGQLSTRAIIRQRITLQLLRLISWHTYVCDQDDNHITALLADQRGKKNSKINLPVSKARRLEYQLTFDGEDPMLPDSGEAQKFLEVGEPLIEHTDLVRGTLTGEADKICREEVVDKSQICS